MFCTISDIYPIAVLQNTWTDERTTFDSNTVLCTACIMR